MVGAKACLTLGPKDFIVGFVSKVARGQFELTLGVIISPKWMALTTLLLDQCKHRRVGEREREKSSESGREREGEREGERKKERALYTGTKINFRSIESLLHTNIICINNSKI